MAREQVLGEQQFARSTLEPTKVDALALEGHTTLGEAADLSDRDEEIPTLDLDHRPHDRRVRIIAQSRHQVLDATDPVAVLVKDRTA